MPVPPSVTTRVVRGTYVDSSGNAEVGTVTFRLDQPLIATVEAWGVIPGIITETLDATGHFSVTLMTDNDIDLFPTGFRYIVQERFNGGYVRTYAIELPSSVDPLDLPTASQFDPGEVGLAVVHSVNGLTGIVQLTASLLGAVPLTSRGVANGVATLDVNGLVPASQLPAGQGGVASVDGRTGVVVLTDLYAALGHTHTYPVTSVNTRTGVVVLTASDVGAVALSSLAVANGVATLDSTGKLLGAQIPTAAVTDVFDAASQSAMLALSALQGDIARRTDINQTYVLATNDPTQLANWKLILTPAAAVSSVNGQTGVVVLTAANVNAVPTSAVGAANGVASLDASTLVPVAQIPGLNASKITAGLLDINRLPTGSSSTTVSVGNHTHAYVATSSVGVANGVASLDGTGKVPSAQLPTFVSSVNGFTGVVTLAASDVGAIATTARGAANGVASLDAGTLVPTAQIPSLDASKITTGTIDIARVPTGSTGTTVAIGNHAHSYVPLSSVGAASGVASLDGSTLIPIAQIPTGSTSSTVSLGNHTHSDVPTSAVGAANGVASLDASTLVPTAQIPNLDTSKITTGTFAIARIPTGTSSTTVALGNDSRIVNALQTTNNLADVANAATSRANLGLGGAAVLSVGTTTGTVAAGDDSRITGAVQSSTVTTKGDLLVASGSSALARLGVGTDGQALLSDSTAANGLRWVTPDPNPIFPLQAGYGLLAASGDPLAFLTSANTITNNLWYARVWIPAGVVITNLWAACTTAGTWDTTSTPNQLALFTDLGVRVDMTADNGNLWNATGWRGGALAGGPVAAQTAGRFVYIGWCSRGQGGSHAMQFASLAGGPFPAFQTGPSTTHRRAFLISASGSGFPSTFDPTSYATATAFVPLVAVN